MQDRNEKKHTLKWNDKFLGGHDLQGRVTLMEESSYGVDSVLCVPP